MENKSSNGRRTALIAIGAVGSAALLGGAAFAAGRLLRPPIEETGGGGQMIIAGNGPGGAFNRSVSQPKIIPAAGIPAEKAATVGLYQKRQDNSVFVGTGNVEMKVEVNHEGKVAAEAKNDGPTVEVVVGRDTELFQDVTKIDPLKDEGKEVQQMVEKVASLDTLIGKLDSTSTLQVWGNQTGGRVNAKLILFRPPNFIPRP